jgi:hypothetical protein
MKPPIYYIAGPPAMVKGLHEMLSNARINDDSIRAEELPGYCADPIAAVELTSRSMDSTGSYWGRIRIESQPGSPNANSREQATSPLFDTNQHSDSSNHAALDGIHHRAFTTF